MSAPAATPCEGGTVLDVPFRGARNYLQAGDIFTALGRLAGVDGFVSSLDMRHLAATQIAARFSDDEDALGRFEIRRGSITRAGRLFDTGLAVTRRIAYDEQPVLRHVREAANETFLDIPVAGYTACDRLLILMKVLAAQVAQGPWLFTALALERPFAEHAALRVRMTDRILDRQIRAQIIQEGQSMGRIRGVLRREAS